MARIDELKQQLVNVLTEMDKIMPVQFHDIDCDNQVFNFSNVKIDENDGRVYVEIAMWHDNLPSHADRPLDNGRGKPILPEYKSGKDYSNELIHNVNLVKYNNYNDEREVGLIAEHITRKGLISLLNEEYIVEKEVAKNEALEISYTWNGEKYHVSIANKTSDVDSEWFIFHYSNTVVKRSVLDGKDYGPEYWDAHLKSLKDGKEITQSEWFSTIDKTKPSGGFLSAVDAMNGN